MDVREVTVLAAGGTIAMAGDAGAVPALDAGALVAAVPELAQVPGLEARGVLQLPGPQLREADALTVAAEAARVAATGRGVVVTHGTDTLEETAVLCDWLHGAEAPVVFTGAIRPASATGADGPANLAAAVAAAAHPLTAGAGGLACFAGELHAASSVRKVDSTSPRAFGSPGHGPVGTVDEGRVRLHARPVRPPRALDVPAWSARVRAVHLHLGDDGALVRAALQDADGLVVCVLGAGHVPLPALEAVREACARVPVVATVRPERGAVLHETYGFEGCERDLRAAGAICAGALSPQAARMALGACLSAGLRDGELRAAFATFDVPARLR